RPTPGSAVSSSIVRGTSPPCFSMIAFDAAITAFALLRKKPVWRTSRSISGCVALANACGFGYLRKSDFVTMFTRTSVDCAESIVAISSSNGLVKSSVHFAFGYMRLRSDTMSSARSCFLDILAAIGCRLPVAGFRFPATGNWQLATVESVHEHDRLGSPHRSRAARHRNLLQELAAGSGAADADEQSRSRRRRASRTAHRLRRHRKSCAQLGMLRRHRRHPQASEK